jgi:methionyl-tRNA formyltransferase
MSSKMKIEFLTEEDSLYILPFFDEFLRHFSQRFEIVQISCCPMMGSRPRLQLIRELIWLYGTVGFSRVLFRYLKARIASRLPRRRDASSYYSIKQLSNAYLIPYQDIGNPSTEQFVRELRARGADIVVSVACPYLLKPDLLKTPPRGCINVHHAPLPRYKGMMPTFWQLYHGERTMGLTVHTMNERIDNGAVLLQEQLDVHSRETLDQLIRRSKRRAAHAVAQVLTEVESNTSQPLPLSQEGSTYYTFPNRDQIREFRRRGLRAI